VLLSVPLEGLRHPAVERATGRRNRSRAVWCNRGRFPRPPECRFGGGIVLLPLANLGESR
jgi:hypothetical protein